MPEFHSNAAEDATKDCDPFIKGYVMAMYFTDSRSDPDDEESGQFDAEAPLHNMTLYLCKRDCERFLRQAQPMLERTPDEYDREAAGRDFWYTRNQHGTGYLDRDLGVFGDMLAVTAHSFNPVYPYQGDDGYVYF